MIARWSMAAIGGQFLLRIDREIQRVSVSTVAKPDPSTTNACSVGASRPAGIDAVLDDSQCKSVEVSPESIAVLQCVAHAASVETGFRA